MDFYGPMTTMVGGVALLVLASGAFCHHTEAVGGGVYKVAQDREFSHDGTRDGYWHGRRVGGRYRRYSDWL